MSDEDRAIVAANLTRRDAEAVRRAAERAKTTPSNVVRQALLDAGVIGDDPRRKSKPVDLAFVASAAEIPEQRT